MSERASSIFLLKSLYVMAFASVLGLGAAGAAFGQPMCRPALVFRDVHFSAMDRETLTRTWTARLAVDASRCATTSGRFEIGFAQQKETAPDIGFHEPFTWKPDSVEVSLEFAPDEAVAAYWLHGVAPCPCRD